MSTGASWKFSSSECSDGWGTLTWERLAFVYQICPVRFWSWDFGPSHNKSSSSHPHLLLWLDDPRWLLHRFPLNPLALIELLHRLFFLFNDLWEDLLHQVLHYAVGEDGGAEGEVQGDRAGGAGELGGAEVLEQAGSAEGMQALCDGGGVPEEAVAEGAA